MISKKILSFLKKRKIDYEILEHRTVYTAIDKAKTLKVSPEIVVKTLILKGDGEILMALLPGNKKLDFEKFKKCFNLWRKRERKKIAKKVILVKERSLKKYFKGVKLGSIPPFGDLWGIPIFLENSLLKKKKIIINSGEYNFSFKLSPSGIKKTSQILIKGSFSKIKK